MAPRGGSAPRGAQVMDPAGAGDRGLPVGVGGRTGWSRDVREAAAEKGGGSSAPACLPACVEPVGAPPAPPRAPTRRAASVETAEGTVAGKEEERLSEVGPRPTSQVEAGGAGGGATHRSEASSLLMYSSRMLVSMLEGSRAPLMSWPAGEGCT